MGGPKKRRHLPLRPAMMNGFATLGSWLHDGLATPGVRGAVVLVLVVLFGIGGISKLRHRASFAQTLAEFRLSALASRTGAAAVGVVEVGVAAALLLTAGGRLAALLAGAMSLGYVLVVGKALLAGRTFACNCLSQTDVPLSHWTLTRAILMALASAALASVPSAMGLLDVVSLPSAAFAVACFGVATSLRAAAGLYRDARSLLAERNKVGGTS